MTTATLREAKRLSKEFAALQLEMAKMIFLLTPSELKEFNSWTSSELPRRVTELERLRNKNKILTA
jgi:hypothetical protein